MLNLFIAIVKYFLKLVNINYSSDDFHLSDDIVTTKLQPTFFHLLQWHHQLFHEG